MSKCELKVVRLGRSSGVLHKGVQRNAMEEEFKLLSFSVNQVDSHILVKCLVEGREVRLVVHAPVGKRGVEDRVVMFSELKLMCELRILSVIVKYWVVLIVVLNSG